MYGYKNNNFHFYCYSIVIVLIIVIVIVVVLTCKRSQVSGNHRLSADHFPEVTSPSNASCAQYQHQERGEAISITIMMIYCVIHTYIPCYCYCLILVISMTMTILYCVLLVIEVEENYFDQISFFEIQTPFHWWKADTEHSNFSIFHSRKLIIFSQKILYKIQVICDEKIHFSS